MRTVGIGSAVALLVLSASSSRAETPLVAFDVPLIAECRDVTPAGFRENYKREVIEVVFKISPQLMVGEEKDLKRLHYEISTEQQMPVVGYLPNAQVATDVVDGKIAIQNGSHHGEISFRYLILPNTGDGNLTGDLASSHAQFGLLAPKQLLIGSGTIERGCGVYYELRPTTQDTLQRQRDFACLFEVPAAWRADFVTIRCQSRGTKRGLGGLVDSEVVCGSGLFCVGLYKRDDGEARAYADQLARKQQAYFNQLVAQAKPQRGGSGLGESIAALDRIFAGSKSKAKISKATAIGAAIQSQIEEGQLASVVPEVRAGGGMKSTLIEDLDPPTEPAETKAALADVKSAKQALRGMNGR